MCLPCAACTGHRPSCYLVKAWSRRRRRTRSGDALQNLSGTPKQMRIAARSSRGAADEEGQFDAMTAKAIVLATRDWSDPWTTVATVVELRFLSPKSQRWWGEGSERAEGLVSNHWLLLSASQPLATAVLDHHSTILPLMIMYVDLFLAHSAPELNLTTVPDLIALVSQTRIRMLRSKDSQLLAEA